MDQPGFVLAADLLQHKDKNLLLAIFQLSAHCSDTAAAWALKQGMSKSNTEQSSAETRQFVAAGVEWLYILSPQDLVDSLFETVKDKMCDLGRYVVEYRLFHWLVVQNCSKGIHQKPDKSWPKQRGLYPLLCLLRIRTNLEPLSLKIHVW